MSDECMIAGAQRLVKAVVMQAVEDYRHAVFYDRISVKEECERFFRDIRFHNCYIRQLEDGVVAFREALSGLLAQPAPRGRKRVFACPICGADAVLKHRYARCRGCGMSGYFAEDVSNKAPQTDHGSV